MQFTINDVELSFDELCLYMFYVCNDCQVVLPTAANVKDIERMGVVGHLAVAAAEKCDEMDKEFVYEQDLLMIHTAKCKKLYEIAKEADPEGHERYYAKKGLPNDEESRMLWFIQTVLSNNTRLTFLRTVMKLAIEQIQTAKQPTQYTPQNN